MKALIAAVSLILVGNYLIPDGWPEFFGGIMLFAAGYIAGCSDTKRANTLGAHLRNITKR